MSFVYRLAERGRTFATRPRGAQMRDELLHQCGSVDAVQLDFSDVLSVSHSFADEFLAALRAAEWSGELPFAVTVTGASPEVSRVLERASARRARRATQFVG